MHLGPNAAYALAGIGALLIYLELLRPGTVAAGLAGAALLTWSAFELSRYPVHIPALLSIAAGLILLLVEVFWNTRFAGPVTGTAALAFGSLHLVAGPRPLSAFVALPVSLIFAAVSTLLAASARRARRNKRVDVGT
jgi:membrane-bound ClpP family serine protease